VALYRFENTHKKNTWRRKKTRKLRITLAPETSGYLGFLKEMHMGWILSS